MEKGNKKFKGEIWMIDYLQMLLGKGFATSLDSLSRRCHELLTAVKNMRSSALHLAGATAYLVRSNSRGLLIFTIGVGLKPRFA